MKYIYLAFLLLIFHTIMMAQAPCATELYATTPSVETVEKQISDWIQKHKNDAHTRSVVTVPVVFHILYNADEENISDAEILKQLSVLNRDFRRNNPDTVNTPEAWKQLGADVEFEFCLASCDTSGNVTSGITRTKTSVLTFTSATSVKSSTRGGERNWNPKKYMNVWVCNYTPTIYGLSTYPTTLNSKPNEDGIIINYRYFGVKNSLIQGRTLVHEVGHWFNLIHIFGDSIITACAARTDYVEDTPPQRASTSGCPGFPTRDVCSPTGNGNMFMNYMDYTFENCMNLFTQGQKERMWAALNLYRPEILTSDGCLLVANNEVTLKPFNISPNPISTGFFKIENAEIAADLTISNIVGQTVFNKKNIAETEIIDFSTQPTGIYFITLSKINKKITRKIVKN